MITAGVLMLISVAVITLNGTFNVWYASKALYVAGASLILLGR